VCWPASCTNDPIGSGCGSSHSPCGFCSCTPSCAGAACGHVSDGCATTCSEVCAPGQSGCVTDLDCQGGTFCAQNAGAQFGLPASASVCVPSECLTASFQDLDCGHAGAACGLECPTCTPECAGSECGVDPVCGTDCQPGCDFSSLPAGSVGACMDRDCAVVADVADSPGLPAVPMPLPEATTAAVGAVAGQFCQCGVWRHGPAYPRSERLGPA
jgi:hypothetical protein